MGIEGGSGRHISGKAESILAAVRDPAIRDQSLVNHAARWLRTDERAARAWLETQTLLSPEDTAKLLSAARHASAP